jgi:uncharacterized SAM-binding protein YcdF (DUF218 family)
MRPSALGLRILAWPARCLVITEDPVPSDLIVVLAGDWTGTRLRHAARLVERGFASQILVSGPKIAYERCESELAIDWATQQGFPESIFLAFPNNARSTQDEARQLIGEVQARGARNILVVTSDFHTRRTRRIYGRFAPGLSVRVVGVPHPRFPVNAWWHNAYSAKMLLVEWAKTVKSWFTLAASAG